jgi:glycosyltransferase involved in cell wall biosynthesis
MATKRTVLIVHQVEVQHYRVGVYNYLSRYLAAKGWHLTVVSSRVEHGFVDPIEFDLHFLPLRMTRLRAVILELRPEAVILFVNLRELYLFPLILFLRFARIPVIYWGHAIDLEHKDARLKRLAYSAEHALVDAILLYGADLKRFVSSKHAHKVFIANNTLNTTQLKQRKPDRSRVLHEHGIRTTRNVICVGRLQRRKRIDELLAAFTLISDADAGLIIIGPDVDHLMAGVLDKRIVWLGPLYGDAVQELMECADVYCMPGHVGLSIVDAFFFGLPLVTTDVDHAPEIMYLKHGVNGVMLPRGNVPALARALEDLLHDDRLRAQMSAAAQETVRQEASIDTMCRGFGEALAYVECLHRRSVG